MLEVHALRTTRLEVHALCTTMSRADAWCIMTWGAFVEGLHALGHNNVVGSMHHTLQCTVSDAGRGQGDDAIGPCNPLTHPVVYVMVVHVGSSQLLGDEWVTCSRVQGPVGGVIGHVADDATTQEGRCIALRAVGGGWGWLRGL